MPYCLWFIKKILFIFLSFLITSDSFHFRGGQEKKRWKEKRANFSGEDNKKKVLHKTKTLDHQDISTAVLQK